MVGLQAAVRANLGGESVTFWAPSLLHSLKFFASFVGDPSLSTLEIYPIDQEYPMVLERGDGWAQIIATNNSGQRRLRASQHSFDAAATTAVSDLAALMYIRAPESLGRPGLAWLRSHLRVP